MSLTSSSLHASVLPNPSSHSKSHTPQLDPARTQRLDVFVSRLQVPAPDTHPPPEPQRRVTGHPTCTQRPSTVCSCIPTTTGVQVLFTGSRDRTVCEWNLNGARRARHLRYVFGPAHSLPNTSEQMPLDHKICLGSFLLTSNQRKGRKARL
jgi:hypothetical protein